MDYYSSQQYCHVKISFQFFDKIVSKSWELSENYKPETITFLWSIFPMMASRGMTRSVNIVILIITNCLNFEDFFLIIFGLGSLSVGSHSSSDISLFRFIFTNFSFCLFWKLNKICKKMKNQTSNFKANSLLVLFWT